MQVKWAVIGATGMAGKTIISSALRSSNICELVGIQGSKHKAEPLSKNWRVPHFDTPEEMLGNIDCDAVYIASPQNVHLDNTILCAKNGKHVLCEKPLALNGKQAYKMVKACSKANVKLGTGFNLRFTNIHRKAKELVEDGEIGKVVSARCQFGQNYPPDPDAFRQKEEMAGGGSMIDMGNHAVDLVEFVAGKKFNKAMAISQNVIHNYPVEDSCSAILEFSDGGFVYVDTYYCVPINMLRNDLEINGTKGVMYTIDSMRGMFSGGRLVLVKDGYKKEYNWDGVDNYKLEFEAFSKAIVEDLDPPCDGIDGLHSQYIMDAIYKSAEIGEKVRVKEIK